MENWHAPDHTKIEHFRSRLSPETQRMIANSLAPLAVKLGFADPHESDFDSTVQEANIAYLSDASLMSRLCGIGRKFVDYIKQHTRSLLPPAFAVSHLSVTQNWPQAILRRHLLPNGTRRLSTRPIRRRCSSRLPLASYGSICGFNLRQLIRHQGGKMKKAAQHLGSNR